MTQASWQPPTMYVPVLGGFGVMNADGEWLDARQSLFAEIIIRYGIELGVGEYVQRGLAALRASFVMMYCPENPGVKALWEKTHPFFGPEDYGFTMENYAHGGRTSPEGEGMGVFTIYDWGNGAAAEAYNRLLDRLWERLPDPDENHGRRKTMRTPDRTAALLLAGFAFAFLAAIPLAGQATVLPRILTFREQVATVNRITAQRLDRILPAAMEKTGFDMWIIISNEDNLDPVFKTMIPMDIWCPIVQILVISKKPGRPVERLNLSRTDMKGLHKDAWDWRAWDSEKKESQWDALARVVRERDPKAIAVNESEEIWAAGGLTTALKERLDRAVGPVYAKRFRSGEALSVQWLETLLEEELDLYERAVAIAHALIAEAFSGRAITPGVTTTDDLLYYYNQRVVDLGLKLFAWPTFRIRYRDPKAVERWGAADTVIRPGDFLVTDCGIEYLRYYTDHTEWAYVLRPGETDVPAGIRAIMAQANRLQDVFLGELREGRSGNEILAAILSAAKAKGIPGPRIYSHSIGLFLHEPGPLIGLPWEQTDTGVRGRVKLVPNSTFVAELSVAAPVPEWDGREMRLSQEQVLAYTPRGAYFLDGRQTRFHLVR